MTKSRFLLTAALAVVLAGVLAGCSQLGTRSDAQIAGDVQAKIAADAAVPTKLITVQTGNGVVTLSGTVASDAERTAAANDAAQVAGVKTVVNNLQVGTAAAQMAQPIAPAPQAPAPVAQAAPQVKPAAVRERAPRRSVRREPVAEPRVRDYSAETVSTQAPAQPAPVLAQSSIPTPIAAPAPPPPPSRVTIPDGTMLSVRLVDSIDSERNHEGDLFHATLDAPLVVDDKVVIPADADVQGQIVSAKHEGHYTGQSALALELTQVSYNGHVYPIKSSQYTRQGSNRTKGTVGKVGGGAAVGAVLGGIIGGGRGAAIGAASGAGVGGAAQTIDKPDPIRLPSETVLSFRLENSVSVVPATSAERNSGRRRMDQ